MVGVNATMESLQGRLTRPLEGTIIAHVHSLRTQEITILGKLVAEMSKSSKDPPQLS